MKDILKEKLNPNVLETQLESLSPILFLSGTCDSSYQEPEINNFDKKEVVKKLRAGGEVFITLAVGADQDLETAYGHLYLDNGHLSCDVTFANGLTAWYWVYSNGSMVMPPK